MPHHTLSSSSPQGNLVHQAVQYDWRLRCITLGRGQQLRKRMVDLLPLRVGDAVLDVGCGTGDLAIEVVKRVGSRGRVVGIDGSEEMIARARQKVQRRHLPIEFCVEQAETLSFPDHSFDVVVGSLVFHALPGSLKLSVLAMIARLNLFGMLAVGKDAGRRYSRCHRTFSPHAVFLHPEPMFGRSSL